MTYARRLLLAKILITICVLNYTIVPLFVDFGPSHIASEHWTPHGKFHMSWILIYHLMTLPVLLFVVWSKLHGSGRSVRLVAYLSLAHVGSFFAAATMAGRLGSDLHDPRHEHLMFGIDGNSVMMTANFIILITAILLSIRRSANSG